MKTVRLDRETAEWLRGYEIEEDRKARRGDLDIPLIGDGKTASKSIGNLYIRANS